MSSYTQQYSNDTNNLQYQGNTQQQYCNTSNNTTTATANTRDHNNNTKNSIINGTNINNTNPNRDSANRDNNNNNRDNKDNAPLPQQQPYIPTTYNAERVVGSGSFGVVYQARVVQPDGTPGELVAIKRVYLDPEFKNRELQIMTELDHPSVVALKHCFYTQHEQNKTYLNLVMPFLPESIYRTIRSHARANVTIPVDRVRRYIYQIIRGLAYIHDVGICHRDLKPQNVLINEENSEVRICDFGSAKKLSPDEANVHYICSRYYRAPELALGARHYTTAVDVWSAGCVFAELLTGKPLFPGETSDDQILRIISILGMPVDAATAHATGQDYSDYIGMKVKESDAKQIIANSLSKFRNNDPTKKHNQYNYSVENFHIQGIGLETALAMKPESHMPLHNNNNNPLGTKYIATTPNPCNETAAVHQQLANAIDLLGKMLAYNPQKRITAFAALSHPFFDPIHYPDWHDLPAVRNVEELYRWEIDQHCWTEREAALIRIHAQHDPTVAEKLLPLWCRRYVGKRVQNIANRDLEELYLQRTASQHQQPVPHAKPNPVNMVFDPVSKTYFITTPGGQQPPTQSQPTTHSTLGINQQYDPNSAQLSHYQTQTQIYADFSANEMKRTIEQNTNIAEEVKE